MVIAFAVGALGAVSKNLKKNTGSGNQFPVSASKYSFSSCFRYTLAAEFKVQYILMEALASLF